MPLQLACIVEGHGEVEAVPVLVRRIATAVLPAAEVLVGPCLRVPRYSLVKHGEVERHVELAARKTGGQGGVLILVDCNGDCPAELGPELLRRACHQRSNVPLSVVLAKREYEAWFLGAAESLRGKRNLSGDLESPPDPEAIRDAKGWLGQRMPKDRKYREVLDQPALTAIFDIHAARRSDSFDKCFREIGRILNELQARQSNP